MLFFIVIFIVNALPCFAESGVGLENKKTFILYFENDTFNQTDRQYTNGIKLTWFEQDMDSFRQSGFTPDFLLPLVKRLPFVNRDLTKRDVSVSLGQNIYTPSDITKKEPQINDRPYAGITYGAMGFHAKDLEQVDTIEFYMGIVGPHSYAETVQKTWHKYFGSDAPEGWRYQLKDEPVIGLSWEQKKRIYNLALGRGFSSDFNIHYGLGLGNAYTFANGGASLRFGIDLPEDFGTCRILPISCSVSKKDEEKTRFFNKYHFGFYFFVSTDCQAVARKIFLDGNTYQESYSVDKELFVADFMTGISFITKYFRLSLAMVSATKEFKKQRGDQKYVTASLSYHY